MNIKYVTYSRYSTSIPIYSVNQETSNKQLAKDGEKIASKIKALKSKIDQRDKLKSNYGVWHVTHDQNDISYAVCADQGYPERHAFGLIEKIKAQIGKISHCEYQTQQNIKSLTKKAVNQLAVTYNDLKNIDKVYKAQAKVNELQSQLGDGIKKLINNGQTLSQMESKAQKMKSYANDFHSNSEKLERMLYWRNIKIKILIALCIIGVIGFIIFIIVMKIKEAEDAVKQVTK